MTMHKSNIKRRFEEDKVEWEDDDASLVKCQVEDCDRVVNLFDEPIFVMRVMYSATGKEYQERWCKRCVVRWAKSDERKKMQ